VRWIPEIGEVDLDPHLLMWAVHRSVPVDRWPPARTVIAFVFDDVPAKNRRWWLVVNGDDVDCCDADPGYDVAVTVATSLRTFTGIWRGDLSWPAALRSGAVTLDGPAPVRRQVPDLIGQSNLSKVPRPVSA
jgi:hypothetical protein